MMALAALAFTACDDESYNDWALPQSNSQEAAQSVAVKVDGASVVNYEAIEDDDALVSVFTPTVSSSSASKTTYSIVFNNGTIIAVNEEGKVRAGDLKEVVIAQYGRAPEKRTLEGTVNALVDIDGVTTLVKNPVTIEAQLTAPVIESAYYYVGSANGWSDSDKTYVFKRADETKSVYDDPIFTVTIPASFDAEKPTERVDEWFKIAPESAYGAENFWDNLIGAETDGCSDLKATLVTTKPQAFSQPKTDGALYYQLTLNMMEYTITVTPLAFEEWIYAPGNPKWDPETAAALRSPDSDGVYSGYVYLDGEFKFTKHRNWKDGEYNAKTFSDWATGIAPADPTFSSDNTNIKAETAGLYKVTVDVANGIFEATLTTWGIVGPAQDGGWDADTDMTWDATENAYVYTGALKAGEFKFRANDGWDINLGGTNDDLVAGGANLTIATDGNYVVKLYPCRNNSEKIYCTVTAQKVCKSS